MAKASDRGAGRVRQRGDTFTAYWWVRVSADDWKQRTKGGFRTEREARKHLNEQLGEIAKGTWSEAKDKRLTVGAFLTDHWLPAARSQAVRATGKPRRASTLAWYETVVSRWLVPVIGNDRLVTLSPIDVEKALAELRRSGGRGGAPLSGRSVNAAHGLLRSALEYAVRLGYATRNPAAAIERQGSQSKVPTPWTAEEARAFLAATRQDRIYAAWLLLLSRGLRRGELAGLRWSALDLEAGTLRVETARVEVNGKTVDSDPKTRAGQRTLSLDPTLVAALRDHKRAQAADRLKWGPAWTDSGLVFCREDGQGLAPRSISQRFERLIGGCGLRRIRLHDLRHTAASLMLADGVPVKIVQEMLGHSDPSITLAIYTHTTDAQHRAAGAAHTSVLTALP